MNWKQSLEAYFGVWRVIVNGTDIRGWYREADAKADAAKYPASYGATVRKGTPA